MTSAQIAIMTTIILYLCLVIFTGVMIGKRSKKSAEGFYLGGRGMGPLVTAMSAEASDMSSYLLMGIPGLAYLSGVADASWTAIGLAIGTYLNFLLVARRLRRYSVELDAITIPSFISKRYGGEKPIIMGIASLIILVFFVPYVASGLAAIGKLFNSLFGWNYMLSVIVGAIVIISYTSVGGFRCCRHYGPDPVCDYDCRPVRHRGVRHCAGRRYGCCSGSCQQPSRFSELWSDL